MWAAPADPAASPHGLPTIAGERAGLTGTSTICAVTRRSERSGSPVVSQSASTVGPAFWGAAPQPRSPWSGLAPPTAGVDLTCSGLRRGLGCRRSEPGSKPLRPPSTSRAALIARCNRKTCVQLLISDNSGRRDRWVHKRQRRRANERASCYRRHRHSDHHGRRSSRNARWRLPAVEHSRRRANSPDRAGRAREHRDGGPDPFAGR